MQRFIVNILNIQLNNLQTWRDGRFCLPVLYVYKYINIKKLEDFKKKLNNNIDISLIILYDYKY